MRYARGTPAGSFRRAGAGPGPCARQHILWAVQGKQNTVYLLGSVHVLRAGDAALSDVAERAYDDSESLVMEIDLDDPGEADPMAMLEVMQRQALLPEGQSLRGVLGSDYESRSTGVPSRRASTSSCSTALRPGWWRPRCCSSSSPSEASHRSSASSRCSPPGRRGRQADPGTRDDGAADRAAGRDADAACRSASSS